METLFILSNNATILNTNLFVSLHRFKNQYEHEYYQQNL